jgi:hypothetical protein
LSFKFDDVDGIEQIVFIGSVVDASCSSSPHPTQETAFSAGVNCPSPGKTFGVVFEERTPRNTSGGEARDWSRVFKVERTILLGSVDQPNGQRGECRWRGRIDGVHRTRTLCTFSIRGRQRGCEIFTQSSVCMGWNWFEMETCRRNLLPFYPVNADFNDRV